MRSNLYFLLFISFLSSIQLATGQIESVKYLVQYDESDSVFHAKLIFEKGSAHSTIDRAQFNAQYSIVIPSGSELTLVESFMPLIGNQNYSSSEPMNWKLSDVVKAPEAQPESDFYSIVPNLSMASFYNDIEEGDTLSLFSLRIENPDICDRNIRAFNSDVDPSSSDQGMNGGDFSNGFTIGSLIQLYSGNVMINEMKAEVESPQICIGDCIELHPEIDCVSYPMSYAWSTGETTESIIVCPNQENIYTVTITDGNESELILESTVKVLEDGNIACSTTSASSPQNIKLMAFPNPIQNGYLEVSFGQSKVSKTGTLYVRDVTGILVFTRPITSSDPLVLATDHWNNGLYYLIFEDSMGVIIAKKIVKI